MAEVSESIGVSATVQPRHARLRLSDRIGVDEASRLRDQFVRIPDGAVLAKGETDRVYVSAETGRPHAIPDTIRAVFLVVPGDPG